MEVQNNEEWKVIPTFERYIINRQGEIRNRFTKTKIFPRKDNRVSLTNDNNDRTTKTPEILVKLAFNKKRGA